MQVHLPTVEPNINTIAASVLSERGVKRLMDVADKMNDQAKCNTLFIPWRFR
jgi:hypothetical protein